MSDDAGLREALEKLRADGAAEPTVAAFEHYARRLAGGEPGVLPESRDRAGRRAARRRGAPGRRSGPRRCSTPGRRDQAQRRPRHEHGHDPGQVAAAGQGRPQRSSTSSRARCSTCAKRRRRRALPLVLMNSSRRATDSLAALGALPRPVGRPARRTSCRAGSRSCSPTDLRPAAWPGEPGARVGPPGHGDLYTALATSGMLEAMLERGYR